MLVCETGSKLTRDCEASGQVSVFSRNVHKAVHLRQYLGMTQCWERRTRNPNRFLRDIVNSLILDFILKRSVVS